MEIASKFDWIPVVTHDQQPYFYRVERRQLSKKQHSSATVYRWVLFSEAAKPRCLVGATDDLYRRVGEYLGHKSKHHIEIRKVFDEHCTLGGKIALEKLQFEPFTINGVVFSEDRLYDPFVRTVVENVALAYLARQNFQLLNATLNKKLVRELQKLGKKSPEQLAEVLNELRARAGSRQ